MANDFNEAFIGGYGQFGQRAKCYAITTIASGYVALTTWGTSVTSASAVDTNAWHQIAVTTRDEKGSALSSIYLDGALQSEEHIQVDTSKSTKIYFGGLPKEIERTSYPYISRKLDGTIRDISIYNVALTPGNIKYIYNHERGT